jgi:hypothetical protein
MNDHDECFDEVIDVLENNLELIYNAHPEYSRISIIIENLKGGEGFWFRLKATECCEEFILLSHIDTEIFLNMLNAYIKLCKAEINFRDSSLT